MGLKDAARGIREKLGGGPRPLRLSPAARDAVRRELAERPPGSAFAVATVPDDIGFRVKVGFTVAGDDAPLREGFDGLRVVVSDEDWARLEGYTVDLREGKYVTLTEIRVRVAETPNPDSRKFLLNQPVVRADSAGWDRDDADPPQLVRMLFDIPAVRRVFLLDTFVTVTRIGEEPWEQLEHRVGHVLQRYFAHGGPPVEPRAPGAAASGEVEGRIVKLLDEVIRPNVKRDGGDILFAGYDDGVVELYLLGSCVGCPSSTATLKNGVERLLREEVPEVREVVAVS